jgi:mono/diheme cytochrome c family protein
MRQWLIPGLCLLSVAVAGRAATLTETQKTTGDKIYSKDQAERGGKQYATVCASCHDPAKVAAGKKPAPPLVGEAFLTKWDGRTLGELEDQIFTTMPNDGSVTLTEDQTADLVAYILQANNFPDGSAALKYGATSKDVVIKK